MLFFSGASSHHDYISYHLREFGHARSNATHYTRTSTARTSAVVCSQSLYRGTHYSVVLPGGYLRGIRIVLLKNIGKKRARRVCVKNMHDVIS